MCLQRLFQHCSFDTTAANYFDDEGAHVAKTVWALHKVECEVANNGEWLVQKYAESVAHLSLPTCTRCPFPGVVVTKVHGLHEAMAQQTQPQGAGREPQGGAVRRAR